MPLETESPIIGIDLGTTHSLVAIVREGRPVVLKTREGRNLLPSVVHFSQGQLEIGYQARRKKLTDAKNTLFSVKRLLGRGFEDIRADSLPYEIVSGEGPVRLRVGDQLVTAVEVSALILKELKLSAQEALGQEVSRAVITVPAYFNDAQRQATRAAGRLAGLDVLRIINEPTAASLAYGLDRKRQGLIAVYDLGGGTFDVSILKLHDGIFEVLATNGDTALGGDDLDQALASVMRDEAQKLYGVDPYGDPEVHASVLEAAEATKITLSQEEKAVAKFAFAEREFRREWSREEFEKLVTPILERTWGPCLQALKDAGVNASELSDVVLVGGPTRLGLVQKTVENIFGKKPNTSVHPDEVVAEGAAIQADILAGNNQELLLLDVVPLTLGIETYGGLMSPLIPRNTRIPTVAREVFTTFVENQTGVDIHVLQGEREKVAENRSLAQFKLKGVEPAPAGTPRVEVTFLIDADGILQVAAKDLKTGHEQSIEVRPSFGLADTEVERMLQSGLEHSEEDRSYRRLIEARNDAEPVLRAAEKKLPDAFRVLPLAEAQGIEQAVRSLRKALSGEDPKAIRQEKEHLNGLTVRLAELLIGEILRK